MQKCWEISILLCVFNLVTREESVSQVPSMYNTSNLYKFGE